MEKYTFEIDLGSRAGFLTEFIAKTAVRFGSNQDEIKDVGKRYIFKKSKEGHVFENDMLDENPVSNVAKAYDITEPELREIILDGALAGIAKYIVMNGDFEELKKGLAFWGIDVEAVLKSEKLFAAVVNQVVGSIALTRETDKDGPFGYHALVEYKLMQEDDDPVEAIFKAIAQVFGEDGEELMILNLRSRGAEDYDIERFRANLQFLQGMRRDRI